MATARIKVLEEEEQERLHDVCLRILEELGVLVRSPSVLRLLETSGAEVDHQKGIARIPEGMVMEALEKAPKRFRLCGRDPRRDFEVPSAGFPRISTNGLAVYMTDLETGERRSTTRADVAAFAKLADSLDAVDFIWPEVTASDVPQAAHSIHEMWTTLKNTTKHVQGDAASAAEARAQIQLASLVAGGEKELRKRPIISVTLCPIAPLSFERGAVEAQVEFARAGIPVSSMSMSLSGLSAPVTLAGTLANANAENLASLVITQFAAPGAPHIYSSESTPMDPALGKISYGATEVPLLSAALAQMARRYGLPCMVGQWGVNGREPGMTVPFSELYTVALTTLSGTDMCSGMGGLEDAKGASLEQMVIDAALWEHCRAFLREFCVDEDSLAFEVFASVGHGNSFLRHPHTVRNFRKELFFRNAKTLAWEATLSDRMVPEAREVAKRLLREHEVPPIDPDALRRGEAILADFEARFIS